MWRTLRFTSSEEGISYRGRHTIRWAWPRPSSTAAAGSSSPFLFLRPAAKVSKEDVHLCSDLLRHTRRPRPPHLVGVQVSWSHTFGGPTLHFTPAPSHLYSTRLELQEEKDENRQEIRREGVVPQSMWTFHLKGSGLFICKVVEEFILSVIEEVTDNTILSNLWNSLNVLTPPLSYLPH